MPALEFLPKAAWVEIEYTLVVLAYQSGVRREEPSLAFPILPFTALITHGFVHRGDHVIDRHPPAVYRPATDTTPLARPATSIYSRARVVHRFVTPYGAVWILPYATVWNRNGWPNRTGCGRHALRSCTAGRKRSASKR